MNTLREKNYTSRNHGAVLLIAILVSSVALAVGIGVYNRTYKELLFASFWKQTQVAFGAADAGLECALYWDLHQIGATSASCFGGQVFLADGVTPWNPSLNGSASLSVTTPLCVTIEITKNAGATTIKSRGYNSCSLTNPRRVERGLRVDY